VALADTDPEIRQRQLDVYRAMTPQQRVDVALGLSEEVWKIAIEGIRHRDPSMSDAQVHQQWLRLLHGPQLARLLVAAIDAHSTPRRGRPSA
jgi:hypothetical protein